MLGLIFLTPFSRNFRYKKTDTSITVTIKNKEHTTEFDSYAALDKQLIAIRETRTDPFNLYLVKGCEVEGLSYTCDIEHLGICDGVSKGNYHHYKSVEELVSSKFTCKMVTDESPPDKYYHFYCTFKTT
jgi:hypothetical protein